MPEAEPVKAGDMAEDLTIDLDNKSATAPHTFAPSLWSFTFLFPIIQDFKGSKGLLAFVMIPAYTWLAFAIASQLIYIHYIREVAIAAHAATTCISPTVLLTISVAALAASLLSGDIGQAVGMFQFIRSVPKPNGEANLTFKKTDENVFETVGGMSMGYRLYSIVFFCIFRSSLAATVMYYAVGHIVHSGNVEEVVLNTVAMVFVMDIDDVFYKLGLPAFYKAMVEAVPPVRVSGSTDRDDDGGDMAFVIWSLMGQWIAPVCFSLLVAALLLTWCESAWIVPLLACATPLACIGSVFACAACFKPDSDDVIQFRPAGFVMGRNPSSVA